MKARNPRSHNPDRWQERRQYSYIHPFLISLDPPSPQLRPVSILSTHTHHDFSPAGIFSSPLLHRCFISWPARQTNPIQSINRSIPTPIPRSTHLSTGSPPIPLPSLKEPAFEFRSQNTSEPKTSGLAGKSPGTQNGSCMIQVFKSDESSSSHPSICTENSTLSTPLRRPHGAEGRE